MRRTIASLAATLTAAVVLTACGGGSDGSDDNDDRSDSSSESDGDSGDSGDSGSGDDASGGDYCDAVNDDLASAAVAYNPVLPGMGDLEANLAFLETAGAPEGLEAEHDLWVDYVENIDPETFTPEPDDVAAARDALFEAHMDCR